MGLAAATELNRGRNRGVLFRLGYGGEQRQEAASAFRYRHIATCLTVVEVGERLYPSVKLAVRQHRTHRKQGIPRTYGVQCFLGRASGGFFMSIVCYSRED